MFRVFNKKTKLPFDRELRKYLKNRSVKVSKAVLETTIADVARLRDELKEFVRRCVVENIVEIDDDTPGCGDYASMDELVNVLQYDPVAAALLVQLYEEDQYAALNILMMRHKLVLPEDAEERYSEEKAEQEPINGESRELDS